MQEVRKADGEDRVWFQREDGSSGSIPRQWTSLGDEDPFVVLSAGRSLFRVADLLALADLTGTGQRR